MDYNPIIVPLDVPTRDEALALTEKLAGSVGAFKIGKELFVSEGPSIVREIRATGANIFLDLKFHDIPNTVAGAVRAATRLDVQMVTPKISTRLGQTAKSRLKLNVWPNSPPRPAFVVWSVPRLKLKCFGQSFPRK
jgi:orotidine-5'-phosphate decarboxylase